MTASPNNRDDGPLRGIKRTRTEDDDQAENDSGTSNGHSNGIHGPTYHVHQASTACGDEECSLIYFEDDSHDDYEFIRVPRKRKYDLFRVARQKPEDRNTAELPLSVTKPDGSKATMWAKMDTGSDINVIHQSTLEELFGSRDQVRRRMRAMTQEEQINLLDGKSWDASHSVDLGFTAGVHPKQFSKINFVVREGGDKATDDTDGVPNVLLGFPFLKDHSMLMIDVEYCHEAEEGVPVIAQRSDTEKKGARSALPNVVKVKQVKGLVRR